MLEKLNLLPVYDSSEHDLIRDLQVPLLKNSTDYLRGVGFFTSGWLTIASEGVAELIENGGKARIIISPIMEKNDWEALQVGEDARKDIGLKELLESKVDDLRKSLRKDVLNALAWMIADEVLEFRFAVPRTKNYIGNYHDKVGLFKDRDGNSVAIHGSLNDSIQGSFNGEAFSVFSSWIEGQAPYLVKHMERLESLWVNGNSQFIIRQLPEAIHEQIISLRSTKQRPYPIPANYDDAHLQPIAAPFCPKVLFPYQDSAITAWKDANCRGIFEMATGTGKTVTALAAAIDRYSEHGSLALVILVPYLHLLEQWEKNCRDFGFNPILCSGSHGKWQIDVKSKIQDFKLGAISNICIIAVHMTSTSERFREAISKLNSKDTMLIGDEVHGLGALNMRLGLNPIANMRLGLSATPRRWFDDEGTGIIFSYFGNTCFELTLDQAIGTYLTEYYYHPQLVCLTEEEAEEYDKLTSRISILSNTLIEDFKKIETLKLLLIKRAQIIGSAKSKIIKLLSILKCIMEEDRKNGRVTRDILIYCAPGTHKDILKLVSGLGLLCNEFVHDIPLAEREKLLHKFSTGEIHVLVAIKCLDEGIDVPSTRTAFILASSTNPREFVQRRGRVLRKHPGKTEAIIYDFIVAPPPERMNCKNDSGKSILKREMPRFAEFASSARNQFEARSVIRDILDNYEMLNLLDEKPWDVYHNLNQTDRIIYE